MCWGCGRSIPRPESVTLPSARGVRRRRARRRARWRVRRARATVMHGDEPAGPQIRWSVSPATPHLPGRPQLRFSLRIATEAQAQQLDVTLVRVALRRARRRPRTHGPGGDDDHADAEPTLEGPGSVEVGRRTYATLACATGVRIMPHGYEPRRVTYAVEIPPAASRRSSRATAAASTTSGPAATCTRRRASSRSRRPWPGGAGPADRLPEHRDHGAHGHARRPLDDARELAEHPRVLAQPPHAGRRELSLARPRARRHGRYQPWAQTPAAASITADHSCPLGFSAIA